MQSHWSSVDTANDKTESYKPHAVELCYGTAILRSSDGCHVNLSFDNSNIMEADR